jgi:hypothetical protein
VPPHHRSQQLRRAVRHGRQPTSERAATDITRKVDSCTWPKRNLALGRRLFCCKCRVDYRVVEAGSSNSRVALQARLGVKAFRPFFRLVVAAHGEGKPDEQKYYSAIIKPMMQGIMPAYSSMIIQWAWQDCRSASLSINCATTQERRRRVSRYGVDASRW